MIKRYLIDQSLSDEPEEITGDFDIFDNLWCESKDVDKLISDHKAVVETKDNRILELETDLMFKEESIKLQNKSMESMQNKIEELEKQLNKFYDCKYESDKLVILAGRLKRR